MIDTKSGHKRRRSGNKRSGAKRLKRTSSRSGARQSDEARFSSNERRHERYMSLARDAASSGNLIEAENFYQHAEHYLRKMHE